VNILMEGLSSYHIVSNRFCPRQSIFSYHHIDHRDGSVARGTNTLQVLPLTVHDSGRQRGNPKVDFNLYLGIFGNPYELHLAAEPVE
jgi:hypothetical protein